MGTKTSTLTTYDASDLVAAICELRKAASGDSNDAEIEAGHEVADLAENLLRHLGVTVPEVEES